MGPDSASVSLEPHQAGSVPGKHPELTLSLSPSPPPGVTQGGRGHECVGNPGSSCLGPALTTPGSEHNLGPTSTFQQAFPGALLGSDHSELALPGESRQPSCRVTIVGSQVVVCLPPEQSGRPAEACTSLHRGLL